MNLIRSALRAGLSLFCLITLLVSAASAPDNRNTAQSIKRGKMLAKKLCSSCHSTTKKGQSKNVKAPPFRTLSQKYPLTHLEEALAEGIVVAHDNTMPEFSFSPDQIADFIAFVQSISNR